MQPEASGGMGRTRVRPTSSPARSLAEQAKRQRCVCKTAYSKRPTTLKCAITLMGLCQPRTLGWPPWNFAPIFVELKVPFVFLSRPQLGHRVDATGCPSNGTSLALQANREPVRPCRETSWHSCHALIKIKHEGQNNS